MNKNLPLQEGYSITITGRHVMVTEGMKAHALEKLNKLEQLLHRLIDVHLVMDIQKLEQRVDIVVRFNHIKIKVHATSEDMYQSIDRAVEKLQQQILRYKNRVQEHQAKGLSVIEMNVNVLAPAEELLAEELEHFHNLALEDRYRPHRIVKQEVRPLKTLTQEEAIMKMELSQDNFLLFRSEEDQKLEVIYRRHDGHYGVIQPER